MTDFSPGDEVLTGTRRRTITRVERLPCGIDRYWTGQAFWLASQLKPIPTEPEAITPLTGREYSRLAKGKS